MTLEGGGSSGRVSTGIQKVDLRDAEVRGGVERKDRVGTRTAKRGVESGVFRK